MPIKSAKRKLLGPSPWERHTSLASYTSDDMNYIDNYSSSHPKFLKYFDNLYLDVYTKRAALKASPYVVGIVSCIGEDQVFRGSGFILENDDVGSTILSSANILRSPSDGNFDLNDIKVVVHLSDNRSFQGQILSFDPHYNIAAVRIQADGALPTATLRHLDDSVTIDPKQLYISEEKPFQLRAHSTTYNLIPGDRVIALGRHFSSPHDIMAAPGEFSAERSGYECKELFRASCHITQCGIGGPLINPFGEVIGMCFQDYSYTPFLPINLILKWWNQYKENGEPLRPYLGMDLKNLYAADLHALERINLKFPNIFKGVLVEEVIPGPLVDFAGISSNDVIIEFGGKTIRGFLELVEAMWDKVGEIAEVVVLRPSDGVQLHLHMVVEEAKPDKFYRWPLWN